MQTHGALAEEEFGRYLPVVEAAHDERQHLDLGTQPDSNAGEVRVFTIEAPSSFPAGITSITVTASRVADPATGKQPITTIGFANVGGTKRTNPVTLTAGKKMQCNVRTNSAKPSGTVYHPTVILKVTYTGYSGTMFTYSVPFTITTR